MKKVSPSNADIITPTESMLKGFQERQAWFDSVVFQREDHAGACYRLNIPNPGIPRISGMRITKSLRFWQPVAVAALREFYTSKFMRGGLLADHVGLGKTWTTIAFLLAVCCSPPHTTLVI